MNDKQIFEDMKNKIIAIGGLMYQYRSCAEKDDVIYDIENIRHNVIFSQSPLNMNDPFDSQIAFSPDEIYDELIDYVLQATDLNFDMKIIRNRIIKNRINGEEKWLVSDINKLRGHVLKYRQATHNIHMKLHEFIKKHFDIIYKKAPKELKSAYTKMQIELFCRLIARVEEEISFEIIEQVFFEKRKLESILEEIKKVRDEQFVPAFQCFLQDLRVTCFSVSGWDNQLMWAHYANSYRGICIEYDFSKITFDMGSLREVRYSDTRPILSLRSIGLKAIDVMKMLNDPIKEYALKRAALNDENINFIIEQLTVKNSLWAYEQEWRLINIAKSADSPFLFIHMPHIKSITLGARIDEHIKRLILDVCQEMHIKCYQLELDDNDYTIKRREINDEDIVFEKNSEMEHVKLLRNSFVNKVKMMDSSTENVHALNCRVFTIEYLHKMLKIYKDLLVDAYFIKKSYFNLIKNGIDLKIECMRFEFTRLVDESKKFINAAKSVLLELLRGGKIQLKQFNAVTIQLNKIYELAECLKEK